MTGSCDARHFDSRLVSVSCFRFWFLFLLGFVAFHAVLLVALHSLLLIETLVDNYTSRQAGLVATFQVEAEAKSSSSRRRESDKLATGTVEEGG